MVDFPHKLLIEKSFSPTWDVVLCSPRVLRAGGSPGERVRGKEIWLLPELLKVLPWAFDMCCFCSHCQVREALHMLGRYTLGGSANSWRYVLEPHGWLQNSTGYVQAIWWLSVVNLRICRTCQLPFQKWANLIKVQRGGVSLWWCTVLNVCGSGSTDLYMWRNYIELACACTHTNTQVHVKTGKIWIRSVDVSFLALILYQSYIKCYLWGKLDEGYIRPLCTVFAIFSESIIISKKNFFKWIRLKTG